jgi:hypothetical protein
MTRGHGFSPRIHAGNFRAVDRSLEPPTLDGSNLDLPTGNRRGALRFARAPAPGKWA